MVNNRTGVRVRVIRRDWWPLRRPTSRRKLRHVAILVDEPGQELPWAPAVVDLVEDETSEEEPGSPQEAAPSQPQPKRMPGRRSGFAAPREPGFWVRLLLASEHANQWRRG